MNLVDSLNDRQKEAVVNTDGPMLILAGAGSGKTKVLTTKVAYLIEEKNIDPNNILAITFTNKAAKEMKERIFKLEGNSAFYIQISTFHSFGLKILKENCELLGYEKNFTILDSDDSLSIIKKIMKELNIDANKYNPKAIKNVISNNKNEIIDPEKYSLYVNTDFDEIALEVYRKYEKSLKINNAVDFDDLLILPLKLFNNNPGVLQKYQEKYKYVFIDEYQDTNEPQYILSKMISAKYKNITVVGDADQAIFTWRGANYKNILNFEKDYKDAKVVLLEENYRSTKTILNAANNVIKNNKVRKEKNLWTQNEEGSKITYYKAFDEKDESNYVVNEIKKLIEKGVNPKDICVLYRANAQSRTVEEAFLTSNISYNIVGSYAFYNRKEIKDLIAYLKLIYNNKDDVSLLRVINYPKRGIGNKAIENLAIKSNVLDKSLYEVIDSGKELDFKNMIEEIKKEESHLTLTELIDMVLDKSGMKKSLEDEKSIEADIRLENLEEFKSIAKAMEINEGIVSLEELLDKLALVSDVSEQKNDNEDKVTLMTMHAVKGLEYDYVFVVGVEEGLFPHSNSLESNDELEEERRLCYVAITRAKKKLYLINARSRILYGKVSSNVPSRFINEISDEYIETIGKKEDINVFKPKIDKNKMMNEDNDLHPGDMVNHDKYGFGVVVTIDGSIATISFKRDGLKKLMKNHKSIHKM
ncbi:MAG: UvrD-helicase domain-containing protein [Bacilli bacterium]|jgi:ATP-dependent DNA helicase|nr:UvrD-helicase domain-containing protein [Bacilli bacterium]HCJ31662.1 ATP-dependent DNA helicase PcrA [Bacillota bacterium]